jgi:hypothetical protein
MWILKGCKKCGGDIFVERIIDDTIRSVCINCGFLQERRKPFYGNGRPTENQVGTIIGGSKKIHNLQKVHQSN